MIWPWRAIQFKCLYRNDGTYRKPGVHRPRDPRKGKEARALWLDGSGNPLPTRVPGGATLIPTFADQYTLAQINHYALGSAENFLVKRLRGRPNHMHEPIDLAYWIDRNFNTVEDDSIARAAPLTGPILARLNADPVLRDLHEKSVAWRQEKIRNLLLESAPFYLFSRVQQAGSTMVLSRQTQQDMFGMLMRMRSETAGRDPRTT